MFKKEVKRLVTEVLLGLVLSIAEVEEGGQIGA